jgi:exodeoxyribonuclease VII large subunit
LRHGAALARGRWQQREAQLATRLAALDPQQVIARGYALVHTSQGRLVVSPAQIDEGTDLRLRLAEGEARLRAAAVRRT